MYYTLGLIIFLIQLCTADDSNGIDVLPVNDTIACDPKTQPLDVEQLYGYIQTPNFDGYYFYPSHANCSWKLIGQTNHTFLIRFLYLGLDYYDRDALYFYNGLDTSGTLIERFSGTSSNLTDYISSSNTLFIKFNGMENPRNVGFIIYFEQQKVRVQCENEQQITCRNAVKCVAKTQLCDGIDDCGDGTDEQSCDHISNDLNFADGCGKPKIKPYSDNSLRIVGGSKAKPGSWPWIVSMRIPAHEPDGHKCGASVINRQWILTAAHCLNDNDIKPEDWLIYFARYDKLVHDSSEVIRYVQSIHINPDYKGDSFAGTWYERKANDIALIKLNAPLPANNSLISAVCLPELNEEPVVGDICSVIGWGIARNTGYDLVLKQTKVPVISNEVCQQWMPWYSIGNRMMCAGYEEGGHDACQGDSGGPLMRYNANTSEWSIVGIVSTGENCGGIKQAGIYTKVSSFVKWINELAFNKTHSVYLTQNFTLIFLLVCLNYVSTLYLSIY